MAKLIRSGNTLLGLKALWRMANLKYGPGDRVALPLNALTFDVTIDQSFDVAAQTVNVIPVIELNFNTTASAIPLPGNTDFRNGFRAVFGAPAPPGALLSYHMVPVQGS